MPNSRPPADEASVDRPRSLSRRLAGAVELDVHLRRSRFVGAGGTACAAPMSDPGGRPTHHPPRREGEDEGHRLVQDEAEHEPAEHGDDEGAALEPGAGGGRRRVGVAGGVDSGRRGGARRPMVLDAPVAGGPPGRAAQPAIAHGGADDGEH